MGNESDYCLIELSKGDRDRYLAVLAAPPAQREALAVVAAFNLELARVADTVSEEMLGFIRLQWWREALDEIERGGPVRRHAVVSPLAEVQRAYNLPIAWLQQMVAARESDFTANAAAREATGSGTDLAAVEDYLDATGGNLIRLSLRIGGLDPQDPLVVEGGRLAGIGYGLTGLIRACLFHARDKRLMLPQAVLQRHGVNLDHLFDLRRDLQREGKLAAAIGELAGHAEQKLLALRDLRPPRRAIPALLPAKLALLQLQRLRRHRYDLFDYRGIEGRPLDIWRLLLSRYAGRI
ncbi:MAG TPA: squalene/phytoene synthase family protein [Dongiaceae bacterium]|nr:squalene/phytoene synthase family protein [Dongiaceae bacterium]